MLIISLHCLPRPFCWVVGLFWVLEDIVVWWSITGWSFGGVVAYEVALQLAKRGINTKGIILIDAPNPIGHVPLSDTLIKTIAKYDRKTGPVEIGKLVQKQFAMNAQLLSAYDPHETKGVCPPIGFLRSESGYAVEGVTDIPMWLADRSDSTNVVTGWSTLSSSVKVWDIPGHHFQAFDNANVRCSRYSRVLIFTFITLLW